MDALAIIVGPALVLMLVGLAAALIGSRAQDPTSIRAINVGYAFVVAGWLYPLALFVFALTVRCAA